MNVRSARLLLWSPRILGILMCLFLSLFAFDAFEGGRTFIQSLPDFAIHLAPMPLLLAVVALAWRWEWVGALVFSGAAMAYAVFARDHLDWILFISGPLLIIGMLFLFSWIHHADLRTHV